MSTRLLSLLAIAGAICSPALADDWNKQFTVVGKPEIVAEVQDGNIRITTGGTGQVQASVVTRGWRIGPDEVRVSEHQSGNRIEIEIRVPRRHFNMGNRGVRLEVVVPHECALNLHTKDGNIEINGVKGEQRLSTGDGNIEGRTLEGALSVSTGDGNVRMDGRFDALSVNTGDGNIDVEAREGSAMSTSWTLRTGDGNVDLRLPENFAADLDAHTGDGKVSTSFAITVSGSLRESDVRGKINGGGQLLQIRSGDGNIRLSRW